MSLYGIQCTICNIPCAMVIRGNANGHYTAIFERDRATLEAIEAIDWSQPIIDGKCMLPTGYGFDVKDISYSHDTKSYAVELRTASQYLGDTIDLNNQIAELNSTIMQKDSTIQDLESQLADADEYIIQMYETAKAEAETPAEPEVTEPAGDQDPVVDQTTENEEEVSK